MKLVITYIVWIGLFTLSIVSQCVAQVFNASVFHVNPNENVYVQGDFTNLSGGKTNIHGTVHLQGNWYNYDASAAIMVNPTSGLVRFVGSAQQICGGTQGTQFNNVELSNANGLLLNQNAEARETFTFTNGKVFTNANYLIISSNSTGAIIGHGLTRYVVGNLRRYVTGTSPYDLPVGTAAQYELAVLKFNSMSGITYINTNFVQSTIAAPEYYPSLNAIYVYPDVMNPIANPLSNLMSKYSYIYQFLDYGYWVVNPNAITSANYKLTVTERGHTNGGIVPGQHALIKRADINSAWGAYGIYPANSQSGTLTNPITVYMDQLTSFSHFAVGKDRDEFGPLSIELLSFTANCDQNRVKITWSTENEFQNDHFTLEKSRNLSEWIVVTTMPGQLNSNGLLNYTAWDELPWAGVTYYRLKQMDVDGSEHIFGDQWLRYVNCQEADESWIKVFLEGKDVAAVDFYTLKPESYDIHIFDAIGRLLFETSGISLIGDNRVDCKMATVEPSVRLVRVRAGSKMHVGKLLIPGR